MEKSPVKRTLSLVAAACAMALGLAVLGGCVTSQKAKQGEPLLIDGQTPRAILGDAEIARINEQVPESYRQNVAQAEAFGRTIHAYQKLAHDAGRLVAPGGRSPFSYPAAGWVTEHTGK